MNQSKFTSSLESMTGDLHLWDVSTTQVGIKESRIINYSPLTSIDNTDTITFNIPAQPKLFLDNVEVVTKIKIENIPEDHPQVSVNNNLANSLWKNVSVIIGGTNITQSFDYSYAISSFFDLALNSAPDRVDTLLYQQGFYMDQSESKSDSENLTIYKIEAVEAAGDTPAVAKADVKNHSAAKRIERFVTDGPTARVGTLIAPLACSLFQQSKLLVDNLDIQVALSKKEHESCLYGPNNTDAILKITDVYLKCHYKIPVDEAIEGIEMRLKKEPSRYEADAKIVTFRQFPYGIKAYKFNNLFSGSKLPKYFVCAINNRAAYGGNAHRNPWTFFPLAKAQCWINGEAYFPKAVEGQEELFNALQEALSYKVRGSCLVTPENFKINNILAFPLTADRTVRHHMNLMTTGVVDLEIELEGRSGTDYCLIIYAIYDRLIEIDSLRQIQIV